jgi:hypothetical protein
MFDMGAFDSFVFELVCALTHYNLVSPMLSYQNGFVENVRTSDLYYQTCTWLPATSMIVFTRKSDNFTSFDQVMETLSNNHELQVWVYNEGVYYAAMQMLNFHENYFTNVVLKTVNDIISTFHNSSESIAVIVASLMVRFS